MTLTLSIALTLLTTAHTAAAATAARPHSNPRVDTAQRLNRGLAGTPLHGQGYLIERAGWTHGIHPALLAAITGAESTYGQHGCHGNPRNIAGLNSCRTGWWVDMNGDGRADVVPTFRTWGHFWSFFATFVRIRFGRASSPYELTGYCRSPHGGPCPTWAPKIAGYMSDLGFPDVSRYGRG